VTRSEAAAGRNLMDIGGVAERLSVRVRYVRRLVAERRIPYVKLGHLLRFDPAQIDEWLERSRVDEALPTTGRGRRRSWVTAGGGPGASAASMHSSAGRSIDAADRVEAGR
jgi:excisionase family DNA binding protein